MVWSEQWLKRRRNRDDANIKIGVETSIQNAFNQLSNNQLKRWIQIYKDRVTNKISKVSNVEDQDKKKNDQKVPKVFTYTFFCLKILPRDHVFSGELNTLLKGKQNSLTRILWAEEWLRRRADKPTYDKTFTRALSIAQAFNYLSNKQLNVWIKMQMSKSNEKPKSISAVSVVKTKPAVPSSTSIAKSTVSSSSKNMKDKFARLKFLSPDHVFTKDDLNEVLNVPSNIRASNLRKNKTEESIKWAREWLTRRNDKPKYKGYKKELSLVMALNNLSNAQLQMWIQHRSGQIENNVDKYERLMILSPDHEFTKEDLNAILKKPSKDLSVEERKIKTSESVKWAKEWLKTRQDKPQYADYAVNMPLVDAFNKLSNLQLKMWIQHRRK